MPPWKDATSIPQGKEQVFCLHSHNIVGGVVIYKVKLSFIYNNIEDLKDQKLLS